MITKCGMDLQYAELIPFDISKHKCQIGIHPALRIKQNDFEIVKLKSNF